MRVILIAVCLIVTVFARPENIIPHQEDVELQAPGQDVVELPASVQPELQELSEYLETSPDELNRKKKSAITTFCVEIRPSDQKPFQLCEPAGDKSYNQVPQPYYSVQNYGGSETIKPPETIHSGGSSHHSKPAYSAPVKAYSSDSGGSSTASKPAYGAYRSTKPEDMMETEIQPSPARAAAAKADIFPNKGFLDKVSEGASKTLHHAGTTVDDIGKTVDDTSKTVHAATQGTADAIIQTAGDALKGIKDNLKVPLLGSRINTEPSAENDSMRTAYHDDAYSHNSGYGSPTHYIPVSPVHHTQHPGHHSGLVITCQPNLAGYAHGVPAGFHGESEAVHHAAVPNYNYRSAAASYGRPYAPYRPQVQPYGGYKPYQPRPIYKPQAQIYKPPIYSSGYQHPLKPVPHPVKPVEVWKPAEALKPVEDWKPIESQPSYGLQPELKPQPYIPEYTQPGPTPAYQPTTDLYSPPNPQQIPIPQAPQQLPPPPPLPKGYTAPPYYKGSGYSSPYSAPETYGRSSDGADPSANNEKMSPISEDVKEQHTLKKMEEINQDRVGDSWVPEGMEEVVPKSIGRASNKEDNDKLEEAGEGRWTNAKFASDTNEMVNTVDGLKNNDFPDNVASAKESKQQEGGRRSVPQDGGWRNAPQEGEWRNSFGSLPAKEAEKFGEMRNAPQEGNWRNAPEEGGWRNAPQEGEWRNAPQEGGWRNAPQEGEWRNSNGPPAAKEAEEFGEIRNAPLEGGWRNAPQDGDRRNNENPAAGLAKEEYPVNNLENKSIEPKLEEH